MSSSTDRKPPWIELPREVTALIMHKLGALEILTVAQHVCATWRSVCRDPSTWRIVDMASNLYFLNGPYDLYKMCRRAVDLSQGQLVDLTIEMCTADDSLIYILERCPLLQRLKLVYWKHLNEASFSEAIQHLPLLEELQLCCSHMNPDVIETIGISCRLLKSFKLNMRRNMLHDSRWSLAIDLVAERIAQWMPQLRHIELIANPLSNKGLQLILDGCPHLETLDLRGCYNIDFCAGDIAKVCSQRIKNLRRPLDSLDDWSFSGELGLCYPTFDGDDYITGILDINLESDYYENDGGLF